MSLKINENHLSGGAFREDAKESYMNDKGKNAMDEIPEESESISCSDNRTGMKDSI
jgi:hypothetical protein